MFEHDDRSITIDGRTWLARMRIDDMHEIGRHRDAHVLFENGWLVSIGWGVFHYGSNHVLYDSDDREEAFTENPSQVEVAAWNEYLHGELIDWPDGDTVQGYVPVEALPALLDWFAQVPSDVLHPTIPFSAHLDV